MKKTVKSVSVEYYVDGDFSTPLYDFIELLESLFDTDGFFTFITINDMKISKYLEAKGLANKSARGAYYKPFDGSLKKFIEDVNQLIS